MKHSSSLDLDYMYFYHLSSSELRAYVVAEQSPGLSLTTGFLFSMLPFPKPNPNTLRYAHHKSSPDCLHRLGPYYNPLPHHIPKNTSHPWYLHVPQRSHTKAL